MCTCVYTYAYLYTHMTTKKNKHLLQSWAPQKLSKCGLSPLCPQHSQNHLSEPFCLRFCFELQPTNPGCIFSSEERETQVFRSELCLCVVVLDRHVQMMLKLL